MKTFCTVVNDKGLRFNCVLVRKGERYGLRDCLVHEDVQNLGTMVEIYDARYTGDGFTPLGQFVTRYYVSTLLEGESRGLDMCGHEPAWKLDACAFETLRRELQAVTS